MPLPPYHFLLH